MMFRIFRRQNDQAEGWIRPAFQPVTAEQANRRRLRVFLGTLTVALAISLGFTWLRPAEYRASARIEITPAAGGSLSGIAADGVPEPARPFLTEVQILASRPVLEEVATRLERLGHDVSAFGPDPIAGMQSHLQAIPVPSTNVVELVATGPHPELLAPLLNTVFDVYRERLAEAYRGSSGDSMTQADDEVKKLEASIAAKRRQVETLRLRHNIVSLQRDENEVLARVRNLGNSITSANERIATAEANLRALRESAAAGKAVVRPRDEPTLADLEQRALQMRAELRELERVYTTNYLAVEPKAVTLRTRLAELERQIKAQREASQQAALSEAQEELASAQGAVTRIQGQFSAGRQEAGQFTARFNEYKVQQDELTELETVYRGAVQRRAKLEASASARAPTIEVLEAGARPREPWLPLYWRDTGASVGGSLVLALLAMWLVELFNRTEPTPTVVLVQPQPGALNYDRAARALPGQARPAMSLESSDPALLPRQPTFPRELQQEEVTAIVRASDDDGRLVLLLLLSGVSPDEAVGLRGSDVDVAQGLIHIGGGSARDVTVNAILRGLLAARAAVQGSDLLVTHQGRPATRESVDAQLLCAAHDAGIERATEVTADSVRHTYVAFLVRQGIRFADLTQLVGRLPSESLGLYSALAPAGPRVARAAIDVDLPAIRDLQTG